MDVKIAVIGLGYVGLPLARLFATRYAVVGFDKDPVRISELKQGKDSTLEVSEELLQGVLKNAPSSDKGLYCTAQESDLKDCSFYIIAVPTPVDAQNQPDLGFLFAASKTVGAVLAKGDIVVYESTVFPGATEEECVPILEEKSGLVFNQNFYVGYSPERINPGDKKHSIDKILKVTSGSTPEIGKKVDELYASVITAGTHLVSSIRVAEAAKIIENAQRDINIAFVNELAKIFKLLQIDTHEVLEAAGTKWNFLPFKPGLVGGHCVGVDPFYLAQKAQDVGYHPEIILAGRRMNDDMGNYVANSLIDLLKKKGISVSGASVLVLGITFKENCPDVRNTRVVDVINTLQKSDAEVHIYDPLADPKQLRSEYGLDLSAELPESKFDAVVLAVAHTTFKNMDIKALLKENGVVYDVKGILPPEIADERL